MNLLLHPEPNVCLGLLNLLGTPASLMSVDEDNGFSLVAVNDLARQYFGITTAPVGIVPLTAEVAKAITGSTGPQTGAYLERMLGHYRRVVDTGTQMATESDYVTASGETRWSRNVITPVVDNTKITRLLITLVDITEVRRTQHELEASLASLVSGLVHYCKSCQKVQENSGAWLTISSYMTQQGERQFSHGICPSCVKTFGKEGT